MLRARTLEAKDERRQAFLTAALDEFFERGFAAARMDDIARRAGLSKGALYLYFESKEALFTALIDTIAAPNVERLERAAAAAPSAAAALHALMTLAPRLIRDTPLPRVAKVILADSRAFPDVVRRYRTQIVDRVLGIVAGILARGQESGELAVEDPKLTARLVVAPVILSAIWRVVFEIDPEAKVDLDALFAQHERMLLRALAPENGAAA